MKIILIIFTLIFAGCGTHENVIFYSVVPDSLVPIKAQWESEQIAKLTHSTAGRDNFDQAIEEIRNSANDLFKKETIGIGTYSNSQIWIFIPYEHCTPRLKKMCDNSNR